MKLPVPPALFPKGHIRVRQVSFPWTNTLVIFQQGRATLLSQVPFLQTWAQTCAFLRGFCFGDFFCFVLHLFNNYFHRYEMSSPSVLIYIFTKKPSVLPLVCWASACLLWRNGNSASLPTFPLFYSSGALGESAPFGFGLRAEAASCSLRSLLLLGCRPSWWEF